MPIQAQRGGGAYGFYLFVGGLEHNPAALLSGKTQLALYNILGGIRGRSGSVQKISYTQGLDPRTVQNEASRCNDYVTPDASWWKYRSKYIRSSDVLLTVHLRIILVIADRASQNNLSNC